MSRKKMKRGEGTGGDRNLNVNFNETAGLFFPHSVLNLILMGRIVTGFQ